MEKRIFSKSFFVTAYLFIATNTVMLTSAFAFDKEGNDSASTKGIVFIESDWQSALREAKEQHMLIFLDLQATWCGPCKLLKKNTFSNTEVAAYFNKNFINVSIDVERGIGPELANTYQVTGLPTLIITDSFGNIVARSLGYLDAKHLLSFGKQEQKKN